MPSIYSFTHIRTHMFIKHTHIHTLDRHLGSSTKTASCVVFFLTISVYYVRWVVLYPSVSSPPKSLSLGPSHLFTLSIFLSQSLFLHVSAVYRDITHSSIVLLNHGAYPYLLTMHYLLQPPHGCTTSTTTLQLYLLLV